jgi:prepilin-type N-terminal cleavage/methylation domain-containing protein
MKKSSNLKAFSLIELSVVILIIGVLVLGVTQGSRMLREAKLKSAQSLTTSSPVASIEGLAVWLDSTSENAFGIGTGGTYKNVSAPADGDKVGRWNDLNPTSIAKIDVAQSTLAVGSATTATTSTNLAGGAANRIAYQTGAGAPGFVAAPVTSNDVISWNGSSIVWSTPTGASKGFAVAMSIINGL